MADKSKWRELSKTSEYKGTSNWAKIKEAMQDQGFWQSYQEQHTSNKDNGMNASESKWRTFENMLKAGFKYGYVDKVATPPPVYQSVMEEVKDAKISDMSEVVMWIFNNLGKPIPDLDTCPCNGAKTWLEDMKRDKSMKNDFYRNALLKLMPNRAQLEEMGKAGNDDGRELRFLEEIQAASENAKESVLPSSSEGTEGESGISEVPVEAY